MIKVTNVSRRPLAFRKQRLDPQSSIIIDELHHGEVHLWGFEFKEVNKRAHSKKDKTISSPPISTKPETVLPKKDKNPPSEDTEKKTETVISLEEPKEKEIKTEEIPKEEPIKKETTSKKSGKRKGRKKK